VCHVQCQATGPDDLARQAGLNGVEWMGARDWMLPQPEPDACEQLGQRERLRHVVLGAAFEAIDLRGSVGYARHHDHRLVRAGAEHPVQDLRAIDVRHPQVQDYQVVVDFEGFSKRLGSVRREVGQVSRRRQGAADERADARLVLHDEYPRCGCARCRCRRGPSRCLVRDHVRRLSDA
jgi:hypothetical protein